MSCGGHQLMQNNYNYKNSRIIWEYAGKERILGAVIMPKDMPEWVDMILGATVYESLKRSNKLPLLFVLVDKLPLLDNNKAAIQGASDKDIQFAIININRKGLQALKQVNPESSVPGGVQLFIQTVWHELYHLKGDRGDIFPSDKTMKDIMDRFWSQYEKEIK